MDSLRTPVQAAVVARVPRMRWAAALGLVAAACSPHSLHPIPGPFVSGVCPRGCGQVITMTSLGVAGFIIRYRDQAILTAPLFSRPDFGTVIDNSPYVADTAAIKRAVLEHGLSDDLAHVQAILVGHSHYDHLLDVPFIESRYTGKATIYGTPTMGYILAGDSMLRPIGHSDTLRERKAARTRVVVIDSDYVGDSANDGKWIDIDESRGEDSVPDSSALHFRIMAFRSAHGPNFVGITLGPGKVTAPLRTLPSTIQGWKLGEVYAYLIDLVDRHDTTRFRIYFRDAVGQEPNGFPPRHILLHSRVDVAIICAGNFDNMQGYPTSLIEYLHPTWTIVAHWENFFLEPSSNPPPVPYMNTGELARRLNKALTDTTAWMTPEPYARFRFCVCN